MKEERLWLNVRFQQKNMCILQKQIEKKSVDRIQIIFLDKHLLQIYRS